jgi:hypoxia-inducible factor 1-alpha inhibitor (HIF hydroxylase)
MSIHVMSASSPPRCCRRVRDATTPFRTRGRVEAHATTVRASSTATASALQPMPPQLLRLAVDEIDPRRRLQLLLLVALRSADAPSTGSPAVPLATLASYAEAHGWTLPPIAQRQGSLYNLKASQIELMRTEAAASGRGALLERAYNDPLTVAPHPGPAQLGHSSADATTAEALCNGLLPTFDLRSGGALPAAAAKLLEGASAVVLQSSGLFPAGVEKWRHADYLASQLKLLCHVLIAPAAKKRFKYWTDFANAPDRVPGDYAFTAPLRSQHMPISRFFRLSADAAKTGECVYLQQALLQADPAGQQPGLQPAGPLGEGMTADLSRGINYGMISAIAEAGKFGMPSRAQLFVGTAAAAHARTVLHFDQYDNVFMQLSGRKTFLLFDPLQSGSLYPYPIHHPLDRSAQTSLEAPLGSALPRASSAAGFRVTLGPGDCLVLPAYWWHEVITEPGPEDEMVVSLNFWFTPVHRLLQPALPLSPMMRCELARQLEFVISDTFNDRPTLVPHFYKALRAQLDAIAEGRCDGRALAPASPSSSLWVEALACKPEVVDEMAWLGLFEYAVGKMLHLLGPQQVRAFVHDALDPMRFSRLERVQGGAALSSLRM